MAEDLGVGTDTSTAGEAVSRRAFLRFAAWLPVPALVVPAVMMPEPAEAQSMLGLIIGAAGGYGYRGRRYRGGGGGWRRRRRRGGGGGRRGGGGGGSSGREAPELIR